MVPDRDAYTIPEFCSAHGFSWATYYNLPAEDRPREMHVGPRGKLKRISRESASDWRKRMEQRDEPEGSTME